MSLDLNPRRRLRIVAIIDIIKGVTILSVGLGILRAQKPRAGARRAISVALLDLDPTQGVAVQFHRISACGRHGARLADDICRGLCLAALCRGLRSCGLPDPGRVGLA